jgi:hypothetical protein
MFKELKKIVYIMGCLWMPLSLGMETLQKAPVEELPQELILYLSTFLTSAKDYLVAIRNIKTFALTNKRIHSILNNRDTLGSIIQLISARSEINPIRIARLFDSKASLDWAKSYIKREPAQRGFFLRYAAQEGLIPLVKFLLDMGVDINTTSDSLDTPLIMASRWGHLDTVELLIQRGANLNAQNEENRTALGIAKAWGRTPIIKLLKKAGATE